MPDVRVPVSRLERWCANFEAAHGVTSYAVTDGALHVRADDGSTASMRPPFGRVYDGPPTSAGLSDASAPPRRWGVVLVRKGGFAVALLEGPRLVAHKVGQRHVQGRTKAGGQSQQRFARRRDNQARAAYEAAADHVVRVLGAEPLVEALVIGGDRVAVREVFSDPRLGRLSALVVDDWLATADPKRAVLDQAVRDAQSVRVAVLNA